MRLVEKSSTRLIDKLREHMSQKEIFLQIEFVDGELMTISADRKAVIELGFDYLSIENDDDDPGLVYDAKVIPLSGIKFIQLVY